MLGAWQTRDVDGAWKWELSGAELMKLGSLKAGLGCSMVTYSGGRLWEQEGERKRGIERRN